MNMKIKLGARLGAVASLVREGVTLYDIGSDHAYLPVSLLLDGKIPFAYICDVAVGPLSKAESTVKEYCVGDRSFLCLSDGMKNVEIIPPCDIVIAGMGGELISKIIDASPEVKNGDIRLILQPMTKAEELREYLARSGFEFLRELTVTEGKSYTVISCRYTGDEQEPLTEAELILGRSGIRVVNGDFYAGVKAKLETLKAVCDGKKRGGESHPAEEALIEEFINILEEGEKR